MILSSIGDDEEFQGFHVFGFFQKNKNSLKTQAQIKDTCETANKADHTNILNIFFVQKTQHKTQFALF